jgi:hypothetical protein
MASQPLPVVQQGAQRWLRKDGLQERFYQLSTEAPAGGRRQAASEPVRQRDRPGRLRRSAMAFECPLSRPLEVTLYLAS